MGKSDVNYFWGWRQGATGQGFLSLGCRSERRPVAAAEGQYGKPTSSVEELITLLTLLTLIPVLGLITGHNRVPALGPGKYEKHRPGPAAMVVILMRRNDVPTRSLW